MRLNRNELRKIQYDFNSYSNRLLQADFNDHTDVLGKFLAFIESTPIILDYITDCGECDWDVETEIENLHSSNDEPIFEIGNTEEEEVRNVYAVLKYIVEHNIDVCYGIGMGYSSSRYFQDIVKAFNERFIMVLIRHVERYLTKVGIDMGLDDKVVYNVSVQHGQAIIATDNATVTATNQVGVETSELQRLINDIKAIAATLAPEDQETVSECIEVIETETSAERPKKGMLKTALSTLKAVKGITEFGAAVAALAEFISTII
ncbi:MAG: hypothetical protein ACOYIG_00350 [Acetivibrionales bacterium]|jgi:hypothetical protein